MNETHCMTGWRQSRMRCMLRIADAFFSPISTVLYLLWFDTVGLEAARPSPPLKIAFLSADDTGIFDHAADQRYLFGSCWLRDFSNYSLHQARRPVTELFWVLFAVYCVRHIAWISTCICHSCVMLSRHDMCWLYPKTFLCLVFLPL